MDMDPRRMGVLLVIARTGGVLAAAEELHLSASAVSQQLSKLEAETGHALVVRTPRGSALTPAGIAVAEAAEAIENAVAIARARLEGGSELAGTVRLGGFTSFIRTLVIPRLPEWRARYPQLQVQILEDDLPALMRLLRKREIDAVVAELDSIAAEQQPLPSGVTEEPLLDEPWKLVVPTGVLLSPQNVDLAHLPVPWLGVDSAAANAAVIGRLHPSVTAQVETVHQYQETLTALALVPAGEGAAIVPALALSGVVHDGVDVLDVPGLGSRRIVLRRFDPSQRISTPLDTVIGLLRESVAPLNAAAAPSKTTPPSVSP